MSEDTEAQCVFAWQAGPFVFGLTKALDAGWHPKGKPVRSFGFPSMSVPEAKGIGIVLGKYLVSIWCDRKVKS